MARVKVKQVSQQQTGPIHPDLPWNDPPVQQKEAASQPNAELEAMRAQIAEMRAALESQQQANMALMSQPQVQAPPQVRTSIDVKSLPDPTLEPEKYAQELAQQGAEMIEGQRKLEAYQNQQVQSQTGRLNALWEDFNAKYEDYAQDERKVRYAATAVVQAAQERGIDVNKYMFLHPDQFMKDVVKEMDNTFGKPQADDVEGDDEDDNRTVGIFDNAGVARPAAKAKDEPAPSMFDDIRDWQQKTGFSR